MEHFIFSTEPLFASMPSGWTVLSDWGKDLLIALSTALFFLLVCIPLLLRKYWNLHIAGENWEVMTYRRSVELTLIGGLLLSVAILLMVWPTHQTLEIHHAVSILFTKLMIIHAIVQFPTIIRLIRRARTSPPVVAAEA